MFVCTWPMQHGVSVLAAICRLHCCGAFAAAKLIASSPFCCIMPCQPITPRAQRSPLRRRKDLAVQCRLNLLEHSLHARVTIHFHDFVLIESHNKVFVVIVDVDPVLCFFFSVV